MKNLNLLLLLILTLPFGSRATHLVGGEMSYRCLGNNQYEVSLTIYRDCYAGQAQLDQNVKIAVYNGNNQLVELRSVVLNQQSNLPTAAPNNCTSFPRNICTEKGVYVDTFNLPPIPGGYTITHQRCCRNGSITNIPNPGTWGNTYTTSIPPMDNCNGNPVFNSSPPVVLCLNLPVNVDLSAAEPDGDSLYYELCQLLHGGGQANGRGPNSPAPDTPTAPPYTIVPYKTGFTAGSPITANPQFNLDPQTGSLTGRPTVAGQFVFAICVSEYRNGVRLSTTRRDFQFNVSNQCRVTIAQIADQDVIPANLCSGGKIQFRNESQMASSFFWDFGDPASNGDTSRAKNPSYNYPDTGSYQVMLIADPGSKCADTTYKTFRVFDSVQVEYSYIGDQCLNTNSFDFTTSGTFTTDATFLWDFGTTTSLGASTTQISPKGVVFPAAGTYDVTVTVTDKGCSKSFTQKIAVYDNPEIGELVEPAQECLPYTVTFLDQTSAYGAVQHYWIFGDGTTSSQPNPTHTYREPGTYTVQHMIKTVEGCLDSGYSIYPNVIEVFPVPRSKMEVSPKERSIYTPIFTVTNFSEGDNLTETFLPDGRSLRNMTSETMVMEDTGTYILKQVSTNSYGCADTIYDTIRVTTPFNLYVPDAFTPNGDGLNDEFFFTATDVRTAEFHIFNRWGDEVFRSTDLYARWNGRRMNRGELLPGGVYTYVLILHVKKGGYHHREEGTITLIR